MKNISVKPFIPYLVAIMSFVAISFAYFTPEIFQNKTLYQHDGLMGMGASEEAKEFQEKTGEKTLWTNSMFGGMPTYQILPSYTSLKPINTIQKISWLYLPAPASLIFIMLFGAFLLFIALRVNPWLAILGAIAYAFSSYFFIITYAGHIWKLWTLAYIPPTFAGIIWAYRGKYWLGGAITAVYFALQLVSNHPQMTYYFGLMMIVFVVAKFIDSYKNKGLTNFFKASAVLAVAVAIGFAINLTSMYHTAEYSKYSMRGGSELSHNTEDQTEGGLERSYVTSWSYGIGETFSLMIPNVKGGSTSEFIGCKVVDTPQGKSLVPDPTKNKALLDNIQTPEIRQYIAQMPYYWGDQPSTEGPVYAGAFIMFLFVLGIFIVRGWFKWVLVISTAMSIVLSWGSNFMWLTNLFLDYFPYYNKLRAVSSMLIVAELCIPILAILALKEIITNPAIIKEKSKQFYISLGLTAGLTLLFILVPKLFFSFLSRNEQQGFAEMLANPQTSAIYSQLIVEIETVRVSIFRADALRSLLIISIGVALVMLYGMKKMNTKLFLVAVIALVLVDMWTVNKRYLNGDDFKPKRPSTTIFAKTAVDEQILKDTSLDYRVYDLSTSPFQDATTSFYHKSIGGYHGAKIRRYQDIIEHYIGRINRQNVQQFINTPYFDILNMLNTKYIILSGADNTQPKQLLTNPNALGNAWFVDDIKWVENADEEIAAMEHFDPTKTAIIDRSFESYLGGFNPDPVKVAVDSIDGDSNLSGNDAHYFENPVIEMIEYQPNKLVYKTSSLAKRLAVFAEIYYPKGWHVYIDGEESSIFRANYILRAMLIPEGEHTIEFRFDPQSYHTTENIAWGAYILLLAMIGAAIAVTLIKRKKNKEESGE